MATPALRALRGHFSGGRITHIGRQTSLEVLDGADLSDRTMSDISAGKAKAWGVFRQAMLMRKKRFDLAVMLPNSFRAALLCRLSGIPARVGYNRDGRGWLLTHRLTPSRDASGRFTPVPTIDYYNALAEMLGAHANTRRMCLAVTTQGEVQADRLFAEAGIVRSRPIVMLNPGGSFGPSKLWPSERYAALADALVEKRGAQIIINAAPGERAIAGAVTTAMNSAPTIDLAQVENSLTLLKSLMRRASLVVTNDTGARHIAAAMGSGVVTIFGSTDPTWARIDCPHERIVQADVACAPCQRKFCSNPPGPTFHQCMKAITVEMVLSAAEGLLDELHTRLPGGRK